MIRLVFPKLLRVGDAVAVVATSGAVDARRLSNGLRAIRAMGLRPIVMDGCGLGHWYLAGADDIRLRDLHASFASRDVRGIFVARGGYGAGRLLGGLDTLLIRRNPKVFVGYSDVTALHTVLNQACGLVTFHGPMPAADFGDDAKLGTDDLISLGALRQMVVAGAFESGQGRTKDGMISIQNPPGRQLVTIVPGRACGRLCGGNLSLLAASLGTPYEIDTRGKVFFIEEIGEKPYSVDRLFLQLKQAGKLRDAAGLILGDFGVETQESLKLCICELIATENKPTLWGLSCGHTSPNLTLPLGAVACMDTGQEAAEKIKFFYS